MHQYSRTLFRGQGFDRLPHLAQLHVLDHLLLYRRLAVRHLAFHPFDFYIQALVAFFLLTVAYGIQSYVRSNAEQPSCKFRRGLIRRAAPVDPEKNFLGQLLRYRLVLDHSI